MLCQEGWKQWYVLLLFNDVDIGPAGSPCKEICVDLSPIIFIGKRGQVAVLGEEEQDVVDLEKLEGSMQATLKGLKWDYSNTITARITPGAVHVCE